MITGWSEHTAYTAAAVDIYSVFRLGNLNSAVVLKQNYLSLGLNGPTEKLIKASRRNAMASLIKTDFFMV